MNNFSLSDNEAKSIEIIGQSFISSDINEKLKVNLNIEDLKTKIIRALDYSGWVVLNGLKGDPEGSLQGLASTVGTIGVIEDKVDVGPLIMDMTPEAFFLDKISSRGTTAFDLHTDLTYIDNPPDLIIVLCVQPDPKGNGLTILSDLWACVYEFSQQTLDTLMSPIFDFEVPIRCRGGVLERLPILTRDDKGKFSVRFRYDKVTSQYKTGRQAIQILKKALEENKIQFLLGQNAAYIIDNKRIVHGRTAFSVQNGNKVRKLKRIYSMRRDA